MFDWNAKQYSKFEYERTLPAIDLANAINHENVRSVLDIGCGIGNSTAVLKKRFPDAEIIGADSSEDMICAARKKHPGLEFIKLDAANDLPTLKAQYDVVFSNACIQWIPDHRRLLKDMFSLLSPGGILAIQTPLQSKHPVHTIIKTLAKSDKWKTKIPHNRVFNNLTENEYFDVLSALSDDFRIWETVYYHVMPSHQSIIEWYKGTGLRPYLEQLSGSDGKEFLKDVFENVQSTYPIQENGEIIFRFPRLFFTAGK